MQTFGIILIVVLVVLALGLVGWILFVRLRGQRRGGSSSAAPQYGGGAPQPAPGGITGWFGDKLRGFKHRNTRTATGAYEGAAGARRGYGGGRGLDPDEAWDTRVGNEADAYGYEEQELGLQPQHGGAGGAGGGGGGNSYQMNLAGPEVTSHQGTPNPQQPQLRSPLPPPVTNPFGDDEGDDDAEQHRRGRPRSRGPEVTSSTTKAAHNPFDDAAAEPSNLSVRGVSPRPMVNTAVGKPGHHKDGSGGSPTERRSVFRENM